MVKGGIMKDVLKLLLIYILILAAGLALTFSMVNHAYGHGVHQGTSRIVWTCNGIVGSRYYTVITEDESALACKHMIVANEVDENLNEIHPMMYHLIGLWDKPCWELEPDPCEGNIPNWAE